MEIEELITQAMDDGSVKNYQYFNMLKNRSVIFNDECSKNIVEFVALPLINFEKDNSNDPVHLYVNSEGGEIFTSLFLCDIIDNYSKPLYIHIMCYCLSMGCVLACAGSNNPNVHKDCYSYSIGMLHAGYITLSGTSSQGKSFMKFNQQIEDKTKDYILKNTKITEEEYDKHNDEDWWLTSEDMLKYGIVDKIIGKE